MVRDSKKLGRKLGDINNRHDDAEENMYGDEEVGSFNMEIRHNVIPSVTISATAKYIPTNGFVMDHPVNGALNDTTFPLDEDYDSVQTLL